MRAPRQRGLLAKCTDDIHSVPLGATVCVVVPNAKANQFLQLEMHPQVLRGSLQAGQVVTLSERLLSTTNDSLARPHDTARSLNALQHLQEGNRHLSSHHWHHYHRMNASTAEWLMPSIILPFLGCML